MTRVTATLKDEHAKYLEAVKEEEHLDSDAAAVRACIERAQECDDAQQRVAELEACVDEQRDELAAAHSRIDTTNELVEYVEEERSLERKRRGASLTTRAKWWLFGMDTDDE